MEREKISTAGAAIIAVACVAIVSIKVGLYGGLPQSGMGWVLLALAGGYVLYTFVRSKAVSMRFGVLCIACGAYIIWYSPVNAHLGFLVMASGALAIAAEFL